MSTASEILARGKSAVEAELTTIEGDVEKVLAVASAKKAALAAELSAYIHSHQTEVQLAQELLARATGAPAAPVDTTVPPKLLGSAAPAARTAASSPTPANHTPSEFYQAVGAIGWRGVGLIIAGLIVLAALSHVGKL